MRSHYFSLRNHILITSTTSVNIRGDSEKLSANVSDIIFSRALNQR